MSKSKTCHVLMLLENASYPRDGRVRREAKSLVSAGYRVSVICPRVPGQAWHEILDRVDVYRYPAPQLGNGLWSYLFEYGFSMAATFVLSLFLFLREGFDIVHANQPPDTFALIVAFYKLFGKHYVLDHHDLAPELYYARFSGKGNPLVYRTLVWLERLSCRLADHVIATNQSYKAVEIQRGGVPAQRITIVRNGPDLDELQCIDSAPVVQKDGRTILGYVGVMGTQDGVDYLIRSLGHLVCDLKRTDFFCILVGSGSALPSLKSLAQQLGLGDYVMFAGWIQPQSEVARYLNSMDICIAPEPSDPYNDRSTAIKVMEYMALGKPIVAFDLPEHRYSAQDAAVYARPNDGLDFARQIVSLMDDPDRRKMMGEKGRRRIETTLAWSNQAGILIEAYEMLATGKVA